MTNQFVWDVLTNSIVAGGASVGLQVKTVMFEDLSSFMAMIRQSTSDFRRYVLLLSFSRLFHYFPWYLVVQVIADFLTLLVTL